MKGVQSKHTRIINVSYRTQNERSEKKKKKQNKTIKHKRAGISYAVNIHVATYATRLIQKKKKKKKYIHK